jgi:hypothetical protein
MTLYYLAARIFRVLIISNQLWIIIGEEYSNRLTSNK